MMCLTCKHGRNPATLSNLEEGWVGCSLLLIEDRVIHEDSIIFEVAGVGWIDQSYPNEPKTGRLINLQLLHKNVTKCPYYSER